MSNEGSVCVSLLGSLKALTSKSFGGKVEHLCLASLASMYVNEERVDLVFKRAWKNHATVLRRKLLEVKHLKM